MFSARFGVTRRSLLLRPDCFDNKTQHNVDQSRNRAKVPAFSASRGVDRIMTDTEKARKSGALTAENELNEFLVQVERRAFKQAVFAVRDSHAALDIVHDAMFKLTDRYRGRPAEELPLLFQRILQNTIRDFYRRQRVRSTWTTLFSSFRSRDDDEEYDFLDTLEVDSGSQDGPQQHLERGEVAAVIEEALQRLPTRQRQAFILRYWEELDVAETALAMGCSEGSVKTHCSRATHSIAAFLRNRGIEP